MRTRSQRAGIAPARQPYACRAVGVSTNREPLLLHDCRPQGSRHAEGDLNRDPARRSHTSFPSRGAMTSTGILEIVKRVSRRAKGLRAPSALQRRLLPRHLEF
jgi:hypothetical protein